MLSLLFAVFAWRSGEKSAKSSKTLVPAKVSGVHSRTRRWSTLPGESCHGQARSAGWIRMAPWLRAAPSRSKGYMPARAI